MDDRKKLNRGTYKSKVLPGSVADLIIRYRMSPRVLAWATLTKAKNDKILANFLSGNGNRMVSELRRGDLIGMFHSMARTPGEANNWMKVIRGLLDYAVDLEMIPYSPAYKVPKLKMPNEDGFRAWREDEIGAFELHYEMGDLPHTTFRLALYTGAARAELVRLGWANVHGDRIKYRRGKTKVWIDIPILPELAEVLAILPRGTASFLETRDGDIRSDKGLGGDFQRWCKAAGLGDQDETGHYLSLHGLRKAAARRFAEAGASPYDLMAWFGWKSIRQAELYTKSFSRSRGADAAAEKLAQGAPETNVTKFVSGREKTSKNDVA